MLHNSKQNINLAPLNFGPTTGEYYTGTYLQIDGKDFHVCNEEKLSSFSSGTNVTASFKTIDNCKALAEKCVCKIGHKSYGWVEVVDLK